MKLKERIEKTVTDVRSLFTDEIWTMDLARASKPWARFVRFIKLARITLETFAENRMGFQCVSLSYFVTLATVPLVAFMFALSGGLGLADRLYEVLYQIFPADPELIRVAVDKANNIINIARGGGVGLVSALFFVWAILWMMFQVERVFNNVWGIRKIPRKLYKRFGFYFLVLVFSPFLVLLFGTGIAYYLNLTRLIGLDLSDVRFLPQLLGWTAFYIIAALILSVMYKFIPATRVKYRYAIKSALLTSVIFALFQYLYLETQVFVARLNTVYGVIAAIPLFLIWLNFSWQIIIYGAELTYSFQNVDHYNIPDWDEDKASQI